MSLKKYGLDIELNNITGAYVISGIYNGYYISRSYYGYNKKQSIKLFLSEIKDMNNKYESFNYADEYGFSILELVISLAIGLSIIGLVSINYMDTADKLTDRALEIEELKKDNINDLSEIMDIE